ncbi:Retinoic acid induced 16-like protein-domain-containing protein [Dendryphion nanum]|uniref:Retinoic acid induced 16-like protein-domain-containing protein n=1 Tax=Dendryphion nanum TaxID=256645 RepID=A0A9P9ING0_9PLEO|nr:Retinoic acid induced 16-like protein-domain-containing protein [Dendryphion nanum]
MDFFARLLGGGSSQKKQAAANNPQQRLARFKQRYNQILQTWQKTQTLATDREAIGNIRRGFQALTAILNDESRSPAPHLCLSFAAAQQIYTAVSKIAATSHDEGMVRDAVAVYSALIDSEEEDFLENDVFAVSLMNFIGRTVGSGSIGVGEDTEADVVELLFGITTKIRLQPEILPVWFTSASADSTGRLLNQKVDFAGVTQKEDFPLCYQLIDHVHHEGRIGDFARTGLLYIFESASKSTTLEQWIVNSDLPTLMATGLGALYSQLSRKLSILHPSDEAGLPISLKLSDYAEMLSNPQAESFFSEDFQGHMSTFLSYLAFWQDVLEHCRSSEVRVTLIDHFQVLFLQQLLYPSLLESSDIDGGSAVAVLTYLRRILDALDHPELIHMILNYLLALPEYSPSSPITPRSPAAIRRRQSLMLLKSIEKEDEKMNPSLFNLVDLVLGSTDSRDPQTVIASLRLTSTILAKNHGYALGSIIKVISIHHKEPLRTIGALNAECNAYLSLATNFAGEDGLDEIYEAHLKDNLSLLENHRCSQQALALPTSPLQSPGFHDDKTDPKEVRLHYLMPEDPLFRSLLDQLSMFLTNDVETNFALTETILMLGICPQLRLEGWLSVDPADYHFLEPEEEAPDLPDDPYRDMYQASRLPTWEASASPFILACLQGLREQVEALRADIQDWDEHVINRKHVFSTYDEMNEVSKSNTPQVRPPADTPNSSWTPQIPRHVMDGPITPARAASPRGRKEGLDLRHTPTASPAPSRLGGQTLVGSPSRGLSPLPAPRATNRQTTFMADVLANLEDVNSTPNLKRRIRFRRPAGSQTVEVMLSKYQPPPKDPSDDITAGAESESEPDDIREASVGHVITNVVILQNFVLELVALMQVRASLFSEVRHV